MTRVLSSLLLFATFLRGQAVPFEIRVGDETVPPGGLVQIKVSLTDPQPITTSKSFFEVDTAFFSGYEGISVFSESGDAAGAAVIRGSRLSASLLSPLSTFGTAPDYPLLTAVIRTNPAAPVGSQTRISLDASSLFLAPGGRSYAVIVKPGTLTIGGTLSVGNIIPGAGFLPAGATVRVIGSGFVSGTRVDVNEVLISSTQFVSPTEMQVTLGQAAEIGGRRFRVRNPDNAQVTYFSYLRSQLLTPVTGRSLLAATVPLFSSKSLSSGTLRLTGSSARFDALALENQTPALVSVSLELAASSGATVARTTVSLAAGSKFVRETSEIFGGMTSSGGSIRVVAGAAIRMLGLSADEASGTVQPVLLSAGVESPPAQLGSSPASLNFSATAGGAAPPAQTLNLSSTAASLSFTANSTAPWLSVTPNGGAVPATVSIGVNPSGLAPGTYPGSIVLAVPPPAVGLTVPVQLTVVAPRPAIRSIVHSATQIAGPVSPGEFVTLYGDFPGAQTAGLLLTPSGFVDTLLGGTRVLFDGVPAPMVYSSPTQLNAIVPYEIEGRPSAAVLVDVEGARSAPASVAIAGAAPGIFTAGASGRGQAAALNADGTVNGPGNPAARGSFITLFATGEGQTNPPSSTGSVSDASVPKLPRGAVAAAIGGRPAGVLYAGSAPGLASGVLQVNLGIPGDAGPGPAVPLLLRIGDADAPAGVTIAVK